MDGGAGQGAQARAVLADLGVDGPVLVGVAKGEARRPGDETLLLPGVDGQPARELHPGAASPGLQLVRSEEHTSELQSLMRISYAVFCLKKKTTRDMSKPEQDVKSNNSHHRIREYHTRDGHK